MAGGGIILINEGQVTVPVVILIKNKKFALCRGKNDFIGLQKPIFHWSRKNLQLDSIRVCHTHSQSSQSFFQLQVVRTSCGETYHSGWVFPKQAML